MGVAAFVLGLTLAGGCGGGGGSNQDWSMMRLGPGMMGYVPNGEGAPVETMSEARDQARSFADQLGLKVGEVMRFTNNYYAELVQPDGKLATEVLVDPTSGATWLEYGPAMMWNTQYGMMSGFVPQNATGMMGGSGMMGGGYGDGMMGGAGGMMGGSKIDPTYTPAPGEAGQATVDAQQARRIADRWLGEQGKGLTAGEADAFPGYYTLHLLRAGKVVGMLSVNAFTGGVWYHWWHGRLLSMAEG